MNIFRQNKEQSYKNQFRGPTHLEISGRKPPKKEAFNAFFVQDFLGRCLSRTLVVIHHLPIYMQAYIIKMGCFNFLCCVETRVVLQGN